MTRLSAILPAVLLPLLAGGCFPNPDYRDLPNPSVIGRSATIIDTVAVADNSAPTPAESAAIAAALVKGGDSGLRVKVRLPQGVPLPDGVEMRRRIQGLGLDPAIAVVEANANPAGTALVFIRVAVTAPDCARMVTPSEEWSAWARPSMAFGCATYGNLSRMVTDPADLVSPRAYGGADATTTGAAVDRYHQDKVTPLRRTTSVGGMGAGGSGGSP